MSIPWLWIINLVLTDINYPDSVSASKEGEHMGKSEKMDIAKAVRKIRFETNISQAELAEAIGVTQAAISLYERGTKLPGYNVLKKLIAFARKFEVDVEFF